MGISGEIVPGGLGGDGEPLARRDAGSPGPVAAYLARLRSQTSRKTMLSKLRTATRLLTGDEEADPFDYPWHALRPAYVAALASALVSKGAQRNGEPYAARTANAVMAAVRGVLKECWRAGRIDRDTYARLTDVSPESVPSEPAGRGLAPGEVRALFHAARTAENHERGLRDAAALGLLYGGGLRRAEAVGLDVADVDLDAGSVTVRRGKGRKRRTVPLPFGAVDAIADWLAVRGHAPGALLTSVNRGGRVSLRRLTPSAVHKALKRLAVTAGVKDFSTHDLRRTYIGNLLDAGADLATVQSMVGHADPATTARYDRRGDEVKRRAADLLEVPDGRNPY